MKKIVFMIIISFSFVGSVLGINYRGCDSSEIARLKALVNNVNISYDYVMNEAPVFSITINNISPEMYFVDSSTNKQYYYSNTDGGEITIGGYSAGINGRYKFYSAKSECKGVNLGSKYYTTPHYNYYYNDPLCEGLNINLCSKWGSVSYSRTEFENLINEYKNSEVKPEEETIEYKKTLTDKVIDFYVNYYLYILISIIVVCSIIIFISRKKNRFNI